MHLGAFTDIGQARGSPPRLTARVAAEGQAMRPGGGGVAGFLVAGGAPKGSEARPPFTLRLSRPTAQRTAPGGFGLPAHGYERLRADI
jgi:hypothetical protein